jgi:hypothetical protein
MRTPPPRTPEQQQAHDRIETLRIGTLAAVRAYAAQYDVALFGLDDDELLMISIHEAREVLFTGKAKRESAAWLAANKARIVAEREGE